MQPMLNIAIRAAHKAGDFIVRKINKLPDLKVEVKALNDFVSEVDRQAESLIIEELLKAFPNHSILAEESGVIEGSEDFRWIIDPLDGTTNYLHGFPHYAVSIACEHEGRLQHAAIYDPFKQELFAASRGDGATLNNRRLRVAGLKTTQGALLATGFPFRHPEQLDEFLQIFSAFFRKASDISSRNVALASRPFCRFGNTIRVPHQIGLKLRKSDGATVQKLYGMQTLGHHRIRQPKHKCHIRTGA